MNPLDIARDRKAAKEAEAVRQLLAQIERKEIERKNIGAFYDLIVAEYIGVEGLPQDIMMSGDTSLMIGYSGETIVEVRAHGHGFVVDPKSAMTQYTVPHIPAAHEKVNSLVADWLLKEEKV